MWCRFGTTIALVAFGLVSSLISYQYALAVRSRDYSPSEFRALLRGFGYNVTPGITLNDEATRTAIREFQQGYKLSTVDGTANEQTQDFAADVVRVLQANLNLVLKLNPPLPRTQFYGPLTEAAVRQYQKKYNLQENGIANLALRQKLDAEAKSLLGIQESPVRPSTAPTPQPSTNPSPRPRPSLTPVPRATVSPSPIPSLSPRPRATANPLPRPSLSPSPSPSATPTPTPSLSR